MTYTHHEIETLSRDIESRYMLDGERTAVEAVALVVRDLYEGDFCRRQLSLDEEVFSAEDVMNALLMWSERVTQT